MTNTAEVNTAEVDTTKCQANYALVMFTVLTAVNQLHRYILIAAIEPMSNELEFGDKECVVANETACESFIEEHDMNISDKDFCAYDHGIRCENLTYAGNQTDLCEWHYTGTGIEYEILAGPVFIIILGVLGVPLTILAEVGRINRRNVVAICAVCWSLTTLAAGFAKELWEVAIWRFLLGFFQAPFSPFSVALLASLFPPQQRGMAIGIVSSGGYFGYGLSYAFIAVIELLDWRWGYRIAGILGVVLGILTLFTIKDPDKNKKAKTEHWFYGSCSDFTGTLGVLPWSVLIPIFLGFACKMGYTNTLSYNINNYFVEYFPEFPTDVFFSWVFPVSGILSYTLGGVLSDVSGKRFGPIGRLVVIIILECLQIPMYVCFIILSIPANLILGALGMVLGDGWMGIGLSAMADIVPTKVRTLVYAMFFCVMDVIGGCVIVAVSPITHKIGLDGALLWLGTGMLVGGTCLIIIAIIALGCWNRRQRGVDQVGVEEDISARTFSDETSPLLGNHTTAA